MFVDTLQRQAQFVLADIDRPTNPIYSAPGNGLNSGHVFNWHAILFMPKG